MFLLTLGTYSTSLDAGILDLPLYDYSHTYTKSGKQIFLCKHIIFLTVWSDWEIWTAALVSSTSVRNTLISAVRNYAADGKSSQPLGDWYETTDGSVEGFRARPVVGGHFALVSGRTPCLLSAISSHGYLCIHSWRSVIHLPPLTQ